MNEKDKMLDDYILSPTELANELCLMYKGTHMIVEGDTDAFFWKHVSDENLCIYIGARKECNGNKDYVIDVINKVNDRDQAKVRILGIVDLDYDFVGEKVKKIDNLYYYPYHDFEIMLIKSEAFDKLNEAISSKKKRKDTNALRELLFKATYPLGIVRFINDRYKKGYNFQEVKLDKLFDFDKIDIDENKFLEYICSYYKMSKSDKTEFLERYELHKSKGFEFEYICSGHDCLKFLSLLTKKVISNDTPIIYIEEVLTKILTAEYHCINSKGGCDYLSCCNFHAI